MRLLFALRDEQHEAKAQMKAAKFSYALLLCLLIFLFKNIYQSPFTMLFVHHL